MAAMNVTAQINSRRTLAIISHPDAGKTTLTEKLLLLGKAIQTAGVVKAKHNQRQAHSDWMQIEAERGISVSTAVMQFPYGDFTINLLDTPGHEDFSEDTYRTLTAVDSVLMVIDSAKGVEERTIKLMEVCRMRNIPISTFINKLDRDGLDGIDLLDQIESVLGIAAIPMNWPIGMGKHFRGVVDLRNERLYQYKTQLQLTTKTLSEQLQEVGEIASEQLVEEIQLMQGQCETFSVDQFLAGQQTAVYFGVALNQFGIKEWLDDYLTMAPAPLARQSTAGNWIDPHRDLFSGFVFKIQANMDPKHRDRIAFLRICSGQYQRGIKCMLHRTQKEIRINKAVTFNAVDRTVVESSVAGDIIGIHNHGNIQIGDTFYQGQNIKFIGIPNFAPEIFRAISLENPLKAKQLRIGLTQLAEEGSVQVFFPDMGVNIIVGVVGQLQFDLVSFRLKNEYQVQAVYSPVNVSTVRWLQGDLKQIATFKQQQAQHIALDSGNHLAYMAPSSAHLRMMTERFEEIVFAKSREH